MSGTRWITEFKALFLSISVSCRDLGGGGGCCCKGRRSCHKLRATSLPRSACRAIGNRWATGKFNAVQRWRLLGLIERVVDAGLIFRAENLQNLTALAITNLIIAIIEKYFTVSFVLCNSTLDYWLVTDSFLKIAHRASSLSFMKECAWVLGGQHILVNHETHD